jgi:hypothetical protein
VAVTTSAPSTFSMLMFGVRLLLGLHCLLLLLALRLLFLGRGDLLLRLLRELQVLLQDRQGLLGEAGQVGILPRLTRLLLQLVVFLLVLVRRLLRQRDAFVLGDLLQLIAGLAVVLDHALAELLDFVARRLLLRELAKAHLLQAALRRLGRELDVLLRQLLLLVVSWLCASAGCAISPISATPASKCFSAMSCPPPKPATHR